MNRVTSAVICNKLYAEGDNKVRYNDHVTGKYRNSAHKNCNIILRLTKKIPVIFRKFRLKINVIPNVLEKYTTFTVNGNFFYR